MRSTTQTTAPAPEGITDSELDELGCGALMALFATLPAPALDELAGEYSARLLANPTRLRRAAWQTALSNPVFPGRWLGKAFSGRGQGYNYFIHRGRIVRRFPMLNLLAPSRFDGQPAFTLVYKAFRSRCADLRMVDEIRRISPGLYLGIGTAGYTRAQRMIPIPFALSGPQGDYQGDLGRPRRGFDLQRALTP